MRCDRDAASA